MKIQIEIGAKLEEAAERVGRQYGMSARDVLRGDFSEVASTLLLVAIGAAETGLLASRMVAIAERYEKKGGAE